MGLLEDVVKHVAAQTGGDPSHAAMAQAVIGMLGNQGPGSLQSMVQSFQSNGLGGVVQSWIGQGANQPITPDQLHSVLGSDMIQQLGQKAGLSPDMTKTVLATVLPLVVDKLTPNGTMPQASLLQEGLGLLKKLQ